MDNAGPAVLAGTRIIVLISASKQMSHLHWPISLGSVDRREQPSTSICCASLCTLTALSTESYSAQNYMLDGVVEWMKCKYLGLSNLNSSLSCPEQLVGSSGQTVTSLLLYTPELLVLGQMHICSWFINFSILQKEG